MVKLDGICKEISIFLFMGKWRTKKCEVGYEAGEQYSSSSPLLNAHIFPSYSWNGTNLWWRWASDETNKNKMAEYTWIGRFVDEHRMHGHNVSADDALDIIQHLCNHNILSVDIISAITTFTKIIRKTFAKIPRGRCKKTVPALQHQASSIFYIAESLIAGMIGDSFHE